MKERDISVHNGGLGFAGALFLVFLVLKLLGKITWSWWWVTAPLWGGLAIATAVLAVTAIVIVAGLLGEKLWRRR